MPQGHRKYIPSNQFRYKTGPWPICGYCKKNKAANRYWMENGHNNPKRPNTSIFFNSPLIWHGKHICEDCFLAEDNTNKMPFMRSTFMNGNMNNKQRGYSETGFRNAVHESMNRVIDEISEKLKAENANKNRKN